jgi:AhpD family alkylhydroperoxidase
MTIGTELKSRMTHPAKIFPDARKALLALGDVAHKSGVPLKTLALIELRASQINGCSVCVDMHSRELKQQGVPDEQIYAVAAWRDNASFNKAERAALALTESLTRLADESDPVPDDVWADATSEYNEKSMAALLIAIGTINVWNRFNAAIRQVVGIQNE